MPFLRLRQRHSLNKSSIRGKALDRHADVSEATASVDSNNDDCSDDDNTHDNHHHRDKRSSAPNDPQSTEANLTRPHAADAIINLIIQSCESMVYLHNQAGQPYHRGAQCCATPNAPAWKRHSSIAARLRTRFIDEALGLPSAVTELINHPRTKREDVPTLFYTQKDIRLFMKEWEKSGRMWTFAKKVTVNGKTKTTGSF